MNLQTFQNANDFLAVTQSTLEINEVANNLILGISLQLQQFPDRIKVVPYLGAVLEQDALVLAAIMTPPFKLVISSGGEIQTRAIEPLAHDLAINRWPVPGVLAPPDRSQEFATVWERLTGAAYHRGLRERIYELRQVIPPRPVRGLMRQATRQDFDLVAEWVRAFQVEAIPNDPPITDELVAGRVDAGEIYLWEDDRIVSMAASGRPTRHGIVVRLVYTPPEFRGRGYASACVATLSQRLLDSGWDFCSLFTDLANPTSNHIYTNIGYRPVTDFDEYIFEARA